MSSDFSQGPPPRSDPLPAVRHEAADDFDPDIASVTAAPADDRIVAILVHWGGFLTWILTPLILYVMQTDRRSLAAWHAREAFNFQASLTLYFALPWMLVCLVFIDVSYLPLAIGLPVLFMFLVTLYEVIIVVWASIAGGMGQRFRIPLNIPFIRRPPEFSNTDAYVDRE